MLFEMGEQCILCFVEYKTNHFKALQAVIAFV